WLGEKGAGRSICLVYMVGIGAWPPTSTRPSGSRTAVLWYVRGLPCIAAGVQLLVAGSKISACFTGISVPGLSTSSRSAPEKAATVPSGSCTAVEYQRPVLRLPVALVLRETPLVLSTALTVLNGRAK